MRIGVFIIFFLIKGLCFTQNNLRIFSSGGEVFRVFYKGAETNKLPEASVLLKNITNDTLQLGIEFDGVKKQDIVVFLLDKGKKTRNREYNYRISPGSDKIKTEFAGITDPVDLPEPLVPAKTAEQ